MKKNKVYDIEQILKILPHRQPFVLIDRVLEHVKGDGPGRAGNKVKAIKNVTYNEPFFAGHFPHKPVMPGVLIVEAMAQAAAIACWEENSDTSNMDVAIGRIGEVRIRKPVVPGDQLVLTGEVVKDRGQMILAKVQALVDSELVTECEILAVISARS